VSVKSTLPKLKKKADKVWSMLVRKRDGRCMLCGSGSFKTVAAHHWIVSKHRSNAARWDIRNGIALCYGCHIHQTHKNADFETVSRIMAAAGIKQDDIAWMVVEWTRSKISDSDLHKWLSDFILCGS
jgi:hypothetical protein